MTVNSIKTFVMSSGERYVLLVETQTGLPLYFPNLYVTTQIRNRSLSLSAMESALNGISVLLQFFAERGIDFDTRLTKQDYLKINEIDALRDFCQKKFRGRKEIPAPTRTSKVLKFSKAEMKVSKDTEYTRLSAIGNYLEWLAHMHSNGDKSSSTKIDRMIGAIKSRRPPRKAKNQITVDKALGEKQIDLVFEVFRPGSDLNPFHDTDVQIRNRTIFLMLYHLGLRGGELLSIRIRDIDLSKNQLVVARRADEKNDSRTYQPLVKTLDRRLPMKDTLAREIHDYIVKNRKNVPGSKKNDYLFITHKSGPTQGQPLSISGYKKIIETVRMASPELCRLTGHKLRHTWNDNFSKRMDTMNEPPPEERQEQMRSYLMGWKAGSGTAATYNERFNREKAQEASLDLQKNMVRVPNEDLGSGNKTRK